MRGRQGMTQGEMRVRIAPWGRTDCLLQSLPLLILTVSTIEAARRFGEPWIAVAAIVPFAALALVVSFYRDPERVIPSEPGLLVSPADGVVTDIATITESDYLGGAATRIGIFLSPLNVHVNRSPLDGTIEKVVHREGKCLPATSTRCIVENASALIGIKTDDGRRIGVRQITGALARRIVCPVEAGRRVARGERYGMIKLGSRTELLVPDGSGFESLVKIGDVVRGGTTVLGRFAPVRSESSVAAVREVSK